MSKHNKSIYKQISIRCDRNKPHRCTKISLKDKALLKQAFMQGYRCGRQESSEEIAKMRRIINIMAKEVKRSDRLDKKNGRR